MKRKLISGFLLASIMLSSQNLFAADILDTPVQNINEQPGAGNEAITTTQENEAIEDMNPTEEVDQADPIGPIEENTTPVGNQVILTLDSKKAQVNGQEYILVTPPKIINGRTLLPLRFVADQVLGANVVWDNITREVTVTKNQRIVVVKIGEKIATVDGQKVEIEQPAIILNGATLLPIRFISETFGITTDYNQTDHTITLVSKPVPGENNVIQKPVAQFNFDNELYIAGQVVQTIDTSYDISDSPIVEKLWMINNDPNLSTPKLENIFKTPRAGSYIISLKVRNNKGVWSDWTEQTLIITPNEKPEVTNVMSDKDAYAQGQDMNFTYTYNNEEWEGIKSERWTYRQIDELVNKSVIDKPKALFAEGDYIITLQLEDTYGNMSEKKEITIHVTGEVLKSELTYKFTEGKIGDMIDNFKKDNYQSYKEIFSDGHTMTSDTLIMSDSPETVTAEGILYKADITGTGRILLHHINTFDATQVDANSKRLVLIAENTTDKPIHIAIPNKIIKGPVEDSLYLGQLILYDYFKGSVGEDYILKPGEKKYIYDSVSKRWLKGQCISGLMDIITDGKVTFTAAAIGQNASIDTIASMKLLDKSIHTRGTFVGTNISYKLNLETGTPQKFIIGTGSTEWVSGVDSLTGETVQNRGNFGVSYHITLTAQEDMGIILNPRADIFRGAIKWKDGETHLIPAKGYFSGDASKSVLLGVIKAGETKEFEYMLPNGSSAPVLIGFIPQSYWGK